ADTQEAVRLKPDATSYNDRGIDYAALGDHDKAIADYDKALSLSRSIYTPVNRGNSWRATKQFAKARADYDEALKIDPRYTYALNARGLLSSDQGALDKAIADFSDAL